MSTLNMKEFTEVVKASGDFKTKVEATKAIKAFTAAIEEVLAKGDKVTLVGFGSFEPRLQAARSGLVPGTKKKYKTKAKFAPKFKAGAKLKKSVIKLKVK